MLKHLDRQAEIGCGGDSPAAGLHLIQYNSVVRGINQYRHIGIVLGRRAQHGRSADIDVLDGILQAAALPGHRGLERVEVDDHHIDILYAMFQHLGHMLRVGAHAQQAPVHFGVQGLDPAVQHLGETGEFRDVLDGQAGLAQQFCGAAGGEDLHAVTRQRFGKFNNSALVRNADQRPGDFCHCSCSLSRMFC